MSARSPLLPTPLALTIAAVAVLGLLLALAIGLAMGLDGSVEAGTGAFVVGVGGLASAALLAVAGLVERRMAARRLLLGVGVGIALVGAVTLGVGLSRQPAKDRSPNQDPVGTGIGAGACCSTPIFLLLLVPFGLSFVGAEKRAVDEAIASGSARIEQMLVARGSASVPELAAETGIPEALVDDVVERLLAAGRLRGHYDPASRRAFTEAWLQHRHGLLPGVVAARGRLQLAALAEELGVPVPLARDWLFQWIQSGRFTGFVHWGEGTITSADAAGLQAKGGCPKCGATLELAGHRLVKCGHCGSEVYL